VSENAPRLPDFLVIGAMKCATTTLHEQLARQPGLFMSRPKEPNYFSDDDRYSRGPGWYSSLFAAAPEGAICGESSTHYTKLPTFPDTVARMADAFRARPPRLVYVMRHPVDRLVSHYVHERTVGTVSVGLMEAIEARPELIEYGLYASQIAPYLRAFGPENVLPVSFERLTRSPQSELERIGRFVGHTSPLRWDDSLGPQNVGSERLRRSLVREALVNAPVLSAVRRSLVPRSWVETAKSLWRARVEAPVPSETLLARVRPVFDDDLACLGGWLGLRLGCENFREATASSSLSWSRSARHAAAPAGRAFLQSPSRLRA
jgi:hypothetical protein